MLRPPTDTPLQRRFSGEPGDIETADAVQDQLQSFRSGKKKQGSIIRTHSFSGTFTSSQQPSEPLCGWQTMLGIGVGLCITLILAICAGALVSAARAERSLKVIAADVSEIQTSLHDAIAALQEQKQSHTEGVAGLERTHSEGMARLERAQSELQKAISNKPSADQIITRLEQPFTQILRRLPDSPSLTGAASSRVAATPAPTRAHGAASGGTATAGGGTVQVTFVFEPASPNVSTASVFWIGREGAGRPEKRYTDIPAHMRNVEQTFPGECWRARDAKTGAILLDRYCTTIVPQQEVLIR